MLGYVIIAVASFIFAHLSLRIYIKHRGIGLFKSDNNKPISREVLTCGGITLMTILIGSYLSFTFIFNFWAILLIITMLVIASILGIIDDFKDIAIWKKVPLMLLPGIPFIILSLIKAPWSNTYVLWIDFGVLFWILVVPVAFMGFSNGANIIAGYDGLEGGIYVLISLLYFIVGILERNVLVITLVIPLIAILIAFMMYNWYPSKVIMGNAGSFLIGGLLGIIPLIGHFEIVLPIVFMPHLIEFLFKIKYKGHTSVFGIVDEKGIIHNKEGIKSVIHWIISWGNMTEKKITLIILEIEAMLCILAFIIWYIFPFSEYWDSVNIFMVQLPILQLCSNLPF